MTLLSGLLAIFAIVITIIQVQSEAARDRRLRDGHARPDDYREWREDHDLE